MTLQELFPALVQIPFLAIFVWFSLRLLSDFRKDTNSRDEMWREFLVHERSQRMEAMKLGLAEVEKLANGVSQVAQSVAAMAQALAAHDSAAASRQGEILRTIERERNDRNDKTG